MNHHVLNELAAAKRDDLLREATNRRLARRASICSPPARTRALVAKRRDVGRLERLRVALRG
jgi:hypothetical protein